MTDVFVIAPANTTTGGPELCHQLVDTLNKDDPGRAAITYWPVGDHKVPEPYRGYDTPVAQIEDIPSGAAVVLPETYGRLVGSFSDQRVHFWWMSVNNFHVEARGQVAERLAAIQDHAVMHLYQSEYAHGFLASAGLGPCLRLSDRLSDIYLRAIGRLADAERKDIVAFNPAKGMGRTEMILKALSKGLRPAPQVLPLQGMRPRQIREALAVAKVYIDFGGHPGKDRMPREAAAMGCCVLTNRRGSAGVDADVPIPSEFKIDDRKPGFEKRAVSKIWRLLDDFGTQSPRFDEYRQIIAAEPQQFAADAQAVFAKRLVAS